MYNTSSIKNNPNAAAWSNAVADLQIKGTDNEFEELTSDLKHLAELRLARILTVISITSSLALAGGAAFLMGGENIHRIGHVAAVFLTFACALWGYVIFLGRSVRRRWNVDATLTDDVLCRVLNRGRNALNPSQVASVKNRIALLEKYGSDVSEITAAWNDQGYASVAVMSALEALESRAVKHNGQV